LEALELVRQAASHHNYFWAENMQKAREAPAENFGLLVDQIVDEFVSIPPGGKTLRLSISGVSLTRLASTQSKARCRARSVKAVPEPYASKQPRLPHGHMAPVRHD
jgi:hypothetical protein